MPMKNITKRMFEREWDIQQPIKFLVSWKYKLGRKMSRSKKGQIGEHHVRRKKKDREDVYCCKD